MHTPTWTVPPPQGLADSEIRLRMPSIADAPLLRRYAGAEGGLDGVWVPLADGANLEVCEALIRDWLAGWRSRPSVRGRALVIDEASGSKAIGYIGLRDHGARVVEVAFGIAPGYRGRGYASRAARLAADWLIEAGLAREVELRIAKEHVESQRVAQRAGFALVGRVVSQVSGTEDTYDDLRLVRTVLLGN